MAPVPMGRNGNEGGEMGEVEPVLLFSCSPLPLFMIPSAQPGMWGARGNSLGLGDRGKVSPWREPKAELADSG